MKKFLLILIVSSLSVFIFAADNDQNVKVIQNYYLYLQSPDTLKNAYEISPKKVDFDTFRKWYQKVAFTMVKDMRKNSDGSYTFKVHIGENLGDYGRNKEVSLYEVNMKVKDGKIIESASRTIDFMVINTLEYGSSMIQIFDDIKQNTVFLYLIDNKSGNKRVLRELPYDRFGIRITSSAIMSDMLIIQFITLDFTGNIVINLKNMNDVRMTFEIVYVTKDNKYILSYGDNFMTGGGLALEYFNGRKKSKIILDENTCVSDIEYFKKADEDFIKFNTQENTGKRSSKEVSLTEAVNNIK